MSEKNDKKQSAKIIYGPWKGVKIKADQTYENAIELQNIKETVNFVDDLTESLIIQMIYGIKENGIDVEQESFIKNMSFIIEIVQATLLKEMSVDNNMIKMVGILFEMLFNADSDIGIDDLELIINQMREKDYDGSNLA